MHKLQDEEVQTKIKCTISEKLDHIDPTILNVDEAWDNFKTVLLATIREACGIKKTGGRNRKATAWWNKEVKDAITEKKKLYKTWVKTKDEEDYIKYRLARRHSKKVVRTAKEKAWTQYGEKLCETCKTSPREFYKSVKAMRVRDEPFDPATTINDMNGEALHEEEEITKRWESYFKDLLNPSGVRAQGTQSRFNPSHPDHSEPTILESEVRKVVKTSPKGKAAGVDGITTEALFTENGKLDREIETRCQKINAVSYQLASLLKHPSISTSTKAKLINAIFLPTLTYQCQTWSLTKDLERKLVTCEMKCLRKAVNKTRRDKIRNEVIRDMAGAKPVLQHIKQQQVKWFGHITRMPINQPALRAHNTKYSGWRARGRPRKRWSDSVADTLRTQGMSLPQATRLAADRQLCPPATPIGTSGRKK